MSLAEEIQQEVYEYWEENYGLDGWEYGVQVFYDPVDFSNDILIIGNQPGVGEDGYNFEEKEYADYKNGTLSPPSEYNYLNASESIEKGMKKILGNDFETIIKNSIKTNFNFFRARSDDDWQKKMADSDERKKVEEFCLEKVEELRQKMEPEVVLFEGMKAWDTAELDRHYSLHRIQDDEKEPKLAVVSEQSDPLAIGIMHPSARIRDEHRETIGNLLAKEMNPILDFDLRTSNLTLDILKSKTDLAIKF